MDHLLRRLRGVRSHDAELGPAQSRHTSAISCRSRCPTAAAGTTGFLTVYFSPRLRHQGPLWHYQEWVDWPDTVNDHMTIDVVVNGVSAPVHAGDPARRTRRRGRRCSPRHAGLRAPPDRLARSSPATACRSGPGGDFSEAILDLYAAFAKSYPDGPPDGRRGH